MSLKLIIFDFDGTLADTRKNIVTTMQQTMAALDLPIRCEEQCVPTIGLPLAGCFRALFPDLPETKIAQCTEVYSRIFEENLSKIKVQLFPHTTEVLQALCAKGLTLAIASSRGHQSIADLLDNQGIGKYFTAIVGANDVQRHKPDPEPAFKILQTTGYKANEALMIGDMDVDIEMGRNAEMATCAVTWGNGTRNELRAVNPDFIVDNFREILDIANTLIINK